MTRKHSHHNNYPPQRHPSHDERQKLPKTIDLETLIGDPALIGEYASRSEKLGSAAATLALALTFSALTVPAELPLAPQTLETHQS
jgi:hypothetical protein